MLKLIIQFTIYSLFLFAQGCAIYYHDADTGADHIWGVGHLSMKTVPDTTNKQILITKRTLSGVVLGLEEFTPTFSIGWNQSERITVLDKNASFAIQRPSNNDYFQFKFGDFPDELK